MGRPVYSESRSLQSAQLSKVDRVWPGGAAGLNLSGNAFKVGVWEELYPLREHPEYAGRVVEMDNAAGYIDTNAHATLVVGTIAASGINSSAKGMAFESSVLMYDTENGDIAEMSLAAATNLLQVSNHSYGIRHGWVYLDFFNPGPAWVFSGDAAQSLFEDNKFGKYSEQSRQYDSLVSAVLSYLPVVATGNDRGTSVPPSPGEPPRYGYYRFYFPPGSTTNVWPFPNLTATVGDEGGYDTTPSDATAKNILTVGAVDSGGSVAFYSSFGPTDDGRIKPDLVAQGTGVYGSSVSSGQPTYAANTGTSFAAPAVTGGISLLAQHYGQLYGTNRQPWASTLKGLTLHTATDVAQVGPDYQTGWGLLNVESAALLLSSNTLFGSRSYLKQCFLANGGSVEFKVWVTNGSGPLKVTICWTDPVGRHPPRHSTGRTRFS